MWIITEDIISDGADVKVSSKDYNKETKLRHRFRMLDDDDNIYYYGWSNANDSEEAFLPLDDFGLENVGCTEIQYYNEKTEEWETL